MDTNLELLFELDPEAAFNQEPWKVYKNNFYWVYRNKRDWLNKHDWLNNKLFNDEQLSKK